MNDETQARRLAEWLEGPPGTDPPEDVDTDVLAAVYALRPDRAPAPRVSLDDILGSVNEGPFAAPTAGAAIGFPETAAKGTGSVVPLHASTPPARRQRRFPGWVYPLAGVAFAAAATFALVMPTLSERLTQRASPMLSEAEAPPAPSAASDAAAPAPAEEPSLPVAEMTPEPTKAKEADAGEGAAAQGLVAPSRDAGVDGLGPATLGGAAAPPPPAPPIPDTTTTPSPITAAPAAAPATESLASGRATVARPAEPGKAPAGIAEMTTPEAAPTDIPATGASLGDEAAPVAAKSTSSRSYADDAVADLDEADAEEERASRRESKKDAARPAPAAPAASTAVGGGSNGLSDRQRGVPLDYNPSWYTSQADVVAVYSAAAAQEKLGAWAAAAALYEPLASDSRVDVAQDAAWRAAKARWSAGDATRALTLIDAALRRGGQSVFRAHLYVLKGDILAARGQPLDAARAWAAAAAENQRRIDADEPAAAPPK